jgi:hypothetical protein
MSQEDSDFPLPGQWSEDEKTTPRSPLVDKAASWGATFLIVLILAIVGSTLIGVLAWIWSLIL